MEPWEEAGSRPLIEGRALISQGLQSCSPEPLLLGGAACSVAPLPGSSAPVSSAVPLQFPKVPWSYRALSQSAIVPADMLFFL